MNGNGYTEESIQNSSLTENVYSIPGGKRGKEIRERQEPGTIEFEKQLDRR